MSNFYLLDLQEASEVAIRLNQPLERMKLGQGFSDYAYSAVDIQLFQYHDSIFSDSRWEQIKGGAKYKRWGDYAININETNHQPFMNLAAGKYMIKAKVYYQGKPQQDCTVTVVTEKSCVFQSLPRVKGKANVENAYRYLAEMELNATGKSNCCKGDLDGRNIFYYKNDNN